MKRLKKYFIKSFISACLACSVLAVPFLGGCGDAEMTGETTTDIRTVDTTTEIETTVASESTEKMTYPPATLPPIPGQTETSKQTGDVTPSPLDAAAKTYLMSLDNTSRGWGPGSECDDRNRPLYAVSAQKNYGKYDAQYLMDDDKIYLTFDEGYENGYTAKILDVLKEKNVKAVFFITLPYAKSEPALVQRMIDEGHVVGNHSTAHLSFPTMSIDDAARDIKELHDYVEEHFDYTMTVFRFPMGESSDRMQALVKEMGYTSVFWSFAYRDWETDDQPEQEASFEKIVGCAHPGAIYLLHAVSETNTVLLPRVIDAFRAAGYIVAPYPAE